MLRGQLKAFLTFCAIRLDLREADYVIVYMGTGSDIFV